MSILPDRLRKPSQPEISLASIRIAAPCPADWAKMAGDERVRHCAECNLNVYDLSAMTERQVRQFFSGNRGQRVCLRLYRRTDGTILTRDCPWGLRALKRRASRIASAVLSAIISVGVGVANAKAKPQQNSQSTTESQRRDSGLVVIVVDSQGAVVSKAEVAVSRIKEKTSSELLAKGFTDDGGRVQLGALPEGEYSVTITARYFKSTTRTIKLVSQRVLSIDVELKIDPKAATPVEVGGVDVSLVQKEAQVTNIFEMDH